MRGRDIARTLNIGRQCLRGREPDVSCDSRETPMPDEADEFYDNTPWKSAKDEEEAKP